jgi:hypothetical protein
MPSNPIVTLDFLGEKGDRTTNAGLRRGSKA